MTSVHYLDVNKLIEGLQKYTDIGIINIGAVDHIKALSESDQNALCAFLGAQKIKLSVNLAKRIKELANACDGLTAEYLSEEYDLNGLSPKKESEAKQKYKNEIYTAVSDKFKINMSEQELDELTTKLLNDYFEAKSRT